jgi:hypothetical protein
MAWFGYMVLYVTFNNISVISAMSWLSVLLVEETAVPGENHRPVAYHIMLYRVHLAWVGFDLTFNSSGLSVSQMTTDMFHLS